MENSGKHVENVMNRVFFSAILIVSACLASSCGGGGGGDGEYVGAARASLELQPSRIDPGDRTQVRIQIWDVHHNGILLKVRFPDALQYVANSSEMRINAVERRLQPGVVQSDGRDNFVVFFLEQDDFGLDGRDKGTLILELEAVENLEGGEVEVDPDVNDPDIPDSAEFDINNPEFQAESSDDITVSG